MKKLTLTMILLFGVSLPFSAEARHHHHHHHRHHIHHLIQQNKITQQAVTQKKTAETQQLMAGNNAMPSLHAKSYVLMDYNTGNILAERNAHEQLPPASLTKLMTTYLTFEALKKGKLSLDQRLNVSYIAASMPPSHMGLKTTDHPTVRELLTGLLVNSSNDAAIVLAEGVSGSVPAFAAAMNQKARMLGMTDSYFNNPNGLPRTRYLPGDNHSSAKDLAIMAKAIIRDYPDRYTLFSTRTFAYKGATFRNHNHLLGAFEGVDGLKTGFTNAAKWCLVASAKRNNHRLISVVLGSNNRIIRDKESEKMLQYGFNKVTGNKIASNQ